MSAIERETLQSLVDGAAFLAEYGMIVEAVGPGSCRVALPFRDHYSRPGGVIPGFIYMALADTTTWLAIYTLLGADAEMSVTTEMRTSFLTGLRREPVICEARIEDVGSALLFGTAECRSRSGTLATHHTLGYIRPPARN